MDGMRGDYRQRKLFEADPSLITTKREDHWFDRKSFRIEPAALANAMIGFANADGGTLIVGVENDGRVTGIGDDTRHLNEQQQAAIQYTSPPVRHSIGLLPCVDTAGTPKQLLVIEVHPSDQVHRNTRDEVYLRVGDQNRRLPFEAVRELTYDKGESVFDGIAAHHAALSDLDETDLAHFAVQVGVPGETERALRVRSLLTERDGRTAITWGALLLFGRHADAFLPGAFIRFLRYEGTEAQHRGPARNTFEPDL